jgi:hypothetical protein
MRSLRFGELRKICKRTGSGGGKMLLLNGKTEKTVSSLKSLLLTDYEAKVYFTLLVVGESKAGTVSKLSGVPQSKMYDVLSNLEERKLVTKTQARTAVFKASPLNVILEQFRAERIEEVRKATVATKFLGEVLDSLEGLAEQFEGQFRIFDTPVRRRWDK